MTKQVEFFFDIVSPASYIAWTQLPKITKATGAEIIYRPFFLPGVFEKAGSSSPITIPNKGKYLFRDLMRWTKHFDIPFKMNANFPMSSLYAMRGLIAWKDRPEFVALGDALYDAMWVRDQNINDQTIMVGILAKAGIDPAEYMESIGSAEVKQAVFDVTDELVERGGFGAPTFFVGKEMFWGQDRLDQVQQALET